MSYSAISSHHTHHSDAPHRSVSTVHFKGKSSSLIHGELTKNKSKLYKKDTLFLGKKDLRTISSHHTLDKMRGHKFEDFDITEKLGNLSSQLQLNIIESSDDEVSTPSNIFSQSARLNSMEELSMLTSIIGENNFDHPVSRDDVEEYTVSECTRIEIPPFIKVTLKDTDEIVFFERPSLTVSKGTKESELVEEDNRNYEYLTTGKGRNRRRTEAETQTNEILHKSKCINTDIIKKMNTGAYVSNYDMYDTYENIERFTKSIEFKDNEKLEITTYKVQDLERFEEVSKTQRFNLAVMLMQRLLAGNVFCEKQKRFRNMYLPDPLASDVKYHYRLEKLWTYSSAEIENSVSCMCWCPNDGDILAVAYGIFHIDLKQDRNSGYVAIWNIKNPVNPEKKIKYDVPIVSIEFSTFTPQLLAVGMYDGTIEVRDITDEINSLVGTNRGQKVTGSEPIVAIKWVIDSHKRAGKQKQSLLVASMDGNIIQYQLGSEFNLFGYLHIRLNRVELQVEGLLIDRTKEFIEANRYPQIVDLVLHPVRKDEFYAITDEGCYYRCSTNYPQQHLGIFQLHEGAVFCMDYSPFSPKVFLTCGTDWYIRIWISGIYEPIINLSSGVGPVNCAYWSPTHSFIIVAVTSNAVEIWDIRRNLLKPVSTHDFKKSAMNSFTMAKFSKCGRSIAIGDAEGKIIMAAFEDMPFSPHYQYNELEKALYKATMAYPNLTQQIQNLGYFGYEDDKTLDKRNEIK